MPLTVGAGDSSAGTRKQELATPAPIAPTQRQLCLVRTLGRRPRPPTGLVADFKEPLAAQVAAGGPAFHLSAPQCALETCPVNPSTLDFLSMIFALAGYPSKNYHLGERDLLHLLVGCWQNAGRTVDEDRLREFRLASWSR